jgi:hypothetical protein
MAEVERRIREFLSRPEPPHQLGEGKMTFEKSPESFPDQKSSEKKLDNPSDIDLNELIQKAIFRQKEPRNFSRWG